MFSSYFKNSSGMLQEQGLSLYPFQYQVIAMGTNQGGEKTELGRKWDWQGYGWKDQHLQKRMKKKCCTKPATKDWHQHLSLSYFLVSKRKETYSKTTGLDPK